MKVFISNLKFTLEKYFDHFGIKGETFYKREVIFRNAFIYPSQFDEMPLKEFFPYAIIDVLGVVNIQSDKGIISFMPSDVYSVYQGALKMSKHKKHIPTDGELNYRSKLLQSALVNIAKECSEKGNSFKKVLSRSKRARDVFDFNKRELMQDFRNVIQSLVKA